MVEIGGTYYRPHLRGTGLNRRIKDMMLSARLRPRASAASNSASMPATQRSQAAMAKLGAVREGVLRADRITWTGHVRDTVLFSILEDEWPRLGDWRGAGRSLASLPMPVPVLLAAALAASLTVPPAKAGCSASRTASRPPPTAPRRQRSRARRDPRHRPAHAADDADRCSTTARRAYTFRATLIGADGKASPAKAASCPRPHNRLRDGKLAAGRGRGAASATSSRRRSRRAA